MELLNEMLLELAIELVITIVSSFLALYLLLKNYYLRKEIKSYAQKINQMQDKEIRAIQSLKENSEAKENTIVYLKKEIKKHAKNYKTITTKYKKLRAKNIEQEETINKLNN